MKLRFTFIAVLSLLFVATSLKAGEITGIVRDASGKAMGMITVIAFNQGTQKSTFTTDSGIYYINPLPAGTYTVIAMEGALRDTFTGVQITEDNTVEIDLTLGITAHVGTVVNVGGTRTGSKLIDPFNPNPGGFMSTTEIKNSGIRKVSDMVMTTGKNYVSDNGDVSLGGGRPTNTRTMIDGVYTIAPISIPANSIQYMRVYTGGIPAKYGDSSGGIIVIETKSYFNQ